MTDVVDLDNPIFAGLSNKQKMFVVEYAIDFNGPRAAEEAGYKRNGSDRLLKNDKVRTALRKYLKPYLEEANLTQENILKQLQRFLFYDISEFVNSEGYLNCELKDLPYDIRQCILGIETFEAYSKEGDLLSQKTKVKLPDKVAALKMAMDWAKLTQPAQVNILASFWSEGLTPEPDPVEARLKSLEGTPKHENNGRG